MMGRGELPLELTKPVQSVSREPTNEMPVSYLEHKIASLAGEPIVLTIAVPYAQRPVLFIK